MGNGRRRCFKGSQAEGAVGSNVIETLVAEGYTLSRQRPEPRHLRFAPEEADDRLPVERELKPGAPIAHKLDDELRQGL